MDKHALCVRSRHDPDSDVKGCLCEGSCTCHTNSPHKGGPCVWCIWDPQAEEWNCGS